MLDNKKPLSINDNRPKSKTKYTSSKPSFLIPFNASRFLNLPKKSQTPTRQTKTPQRSNQALSPSQSEIKICQQLKNQNQHQHQHQNHTQKSPNQSVVNRTNISNQIQDQKNSQLFNSNGGAAINTSTNSVKANNDIFSILHRKDQSVNVVQSSDRYNIANQAELNKPYNTNNPINKPLPLSIKEPTSSNKIQVHMKSNTSYKKTDNLLCKSNSEVRSSIVSASVYVNSSISSFPNSKYLNNSLSNSNFTIKKDNVEIEQKNDKMTSMMLSKVKSASEKKLKVINKNEDRPKPRLNYKSKSVFNTVKGSNNKNQLIKANSTNNTNANYNNKGVVVKKKFRDLNTSPLLRTKGKGKEKVKSTVASNSIKPKREITPTNSQIKKQPVVFLSPEPNITNYNNGHSNNNTTNGIERNVNSIKHNNSNDNNKNNSNSNTIKDNIRNQNIGVEIKINNPLLMSHYNNNNGKNYPGLKKIIQIDSITKKGFDGQGMKKVNQDNFFVYKNLNRQNACMFIGVCDGHGMFGHDVSGYLISHLPAALNSTLISKRLPLSDQHNLNSILNEIFIKTNANLISDTSVDTAFSGSTCVSIVYTPEKITCANVGDSRAIIGRCVNGTWSSINLSRDHKPTESDEHDRIIKSGGRIEAYKDDEGNYIGPERVWVIDEDIPGLAMSRSFGDEKAQSVGVIAKPEILEFPLEQCDKFVVLASDGIWEFIESDECLHMIKDFYLQNDPNGALSQLYKESAKRWIQQEEVIDDITAVIIFFE